MKKIILLGILILGTGWYLNHKDKLGSLAPGAGQLMSVAEKSQQLQDLKQQVFTSGPLRGRQEANDAYLTRVGTINWTNEHRKQNGLGSLKENSELNRAAQLKLKDMFDRQYFEHISPTGKGPGDLAKAASYEYISVGENLAMGNFKDDKELVQAWMDSPGHRANILNAKFMEIGVAVGQGVFEGKTTWLAVQEFGKPLSSCPAVDASLKNQIQNLEAETGQMEAELTAAKKALDEEDPKTKQEYEDHNRRVAEYNDLVKIYNNKIDQLKLAVTQYNAQVRAYNDCLGS